MSVLRVLGKAALGAAGGAAGMVLLARLVALFAERCTVVCAPGFSATVGAIAGAIAVFAIKGYEPG
jgi:hypothetical protein